MSNGFYKDILFGAGKFEDYSFETIEETDEIFGRMVPYKSLEVSYQGDRVALLKYIDGSLTTPNITLQEFSLGDERPNGLALVAPQNQFLTPESSDTDQVLYGDEKDDVFATGSGNDTLYAAEGNNTIDSGAGDDLIYAAEGNNTVNAGTGNDTVYVGHGKDTFILELGDGAVTVFSYGTTDVITRGSSVLAGTQFSITANGLDTRISAEDDLLAVLKWMQPTSVMVAY